MSVRVRLFGFDMLTRLQYSTPFAASCDATAHLIDPNEIVPAPEHRLKLEAGQIIADQNPANGVIRSPVPGQVDESGHPGHGTHGGHLRPSIRDATAPSPLNRRSNTNSPYISNSQTNSKSNSHSKPGAGYAGDESASQSGSTEALSQDRSVIRAMLPAGHGYHPIGGPQRYASSSDAFRPPISRESSASAPGSSRATSSRQFSSLHPSTPVHSRPGLMRPPIGVRSLSSRSRVAQGPGMAIKTAAAAAAASLFRSKAGLADSDSDVRSGSPAYLLPALALNDTSSSRSQSPCGKTFPMAIIVSLSTILFPKVSQTPICGLSVGLMSCPLTSPNSSSSTQTSSALQGAISSQI